MNSVTSRAEGRCDGDDAADSVKKERAPRSQHRHTSQSVISEKGGMAREREVGEREREGEEKCVREGGKEANRLFESRYICER